MRLLHSTFMNIPGEDAIWEGIFHSQLINIFSAIVSNSYYVLVCFSHLRLPSPWTVCHELEIVIFNHYSQLNLLNCPCLPL